MTSTIRRMFAGCMLVALVTGAAAQAQAQSDFPSKRIHVIVPYPAGGIVDIMVRVITDKLSAMWGQPIVVEAKPGGNANIGTAEVARAEPDGYTWGFFGPATMANPRIYSNLRWSEKSFVGIGAVAWAYGAMVVPPSLPANSVKEFIELAHKEPGKYNVAHPGVGSSVHLNAAIFMNGTKSQLTYVPYKGQPQAILDLIAGRIHLKFASIGLVAEHVKSGGLKALAVIGTERSDLLPTVPTMSEAGFPAINVVPWYGLAAPAGTPQPVVEKIVASINKVLEDPGVRALLKKQALDPVKPMSSKQIAELIASDTLKYEEVIRAAGIKIE